MESQSGTDGAGLTNRVKQVGWGTVRVRSTVLAAVLVTTTLVLGGAVMLLLYANQLETDLEATLTQQADTRARLLDDGQTPNDLVAVLREESMVWIGTPDGTEVAVSGQIEPLEPPVLAEGFTEMAENGGSGEIVLLIQEHYSDALDGFDATGEDDDEEEADDEGPERYELRAATASTADGSLVVVVASEQERIRNAVGSLSRLLLIGLPPLVLLAAAFTWYTTGRALQPVEQIRARATEISGTSLDGRVPVPEGKDEIHQLAVTVNEMLDRIEAHNRSLRQFTADASHELKSPVANLRALVDTSTIDDPAWATLRDRMTGEADRLHDLVSNLLFLAAHDAGRPAGEPEPIALDELVFREAEVAAATGRITVDLGGVNPATVLGVETELYRLTRNLVDNAVRHAKGRVAIAIDLDPAGPACLVVGDDGEGIPVNERDRVFERFTRVDSARARHQGGAGLGLAIVKQIAADHGTSVTVGESPLGGAEFRVCFSQTVG